MEEGRSTGKRAPTPRAAEPEGPAMLVLRAWLWIVPIVMLIVSVLFGAIAVADESWALLAMMVLTALFSVGLLVLHWWALYRFGQGTGNKGTTEPGTTEPEERWR